MYAGFMAQGELSRAVCTLALQSQVSGELGSKLRKSKFIG